MGALFLALHNGRIGWDEILVSALIALAIVAIAFWQDRRGSTIDSSGE